MPSTSLDAQSRTAESRTVPTVAQAIQRDAVKRLGGTPASQVSVRQVELGGAVPIPFSDYRTGDYYVAEKRSADKTLESRLYYSRRGDYIGSLSLVDKERREYAAVEGEQKEYREIYRASRTDDLHVEFLRSESQRETKTREFRETKPSFAVQNGTLTSEKPTRTAFGGDGDHVFCERGTGLFFVVQMETLGNKGEVTSRFGELHKCGNPKLSGFEPGSNHAYVVAEHSNGRFSPNLGSSTSDPASRAADWEKIKLLLPPRAVGKPIPEKSQE